MKPVNGIDSPVFMPPGPGEWRIIDHIAHPGSRCFAQYYFSSMEAGWNREAVEIGLVNRVKIREVNGLMYYQMSLLEPGSTFSEMVRINRGYFEEKRYLSTLRLWDEEVKPSAVTQLLGLQKVPLDGLSDVELSEHIQTCFSVTKQMVETHHRFTYTAFIPVGDFILQASEWSGKDPVDILNVLRSNSPGRLLAIQSDPVYQEFISALQTNPAGLVLLSKVDQEPERAGEIFDALCSFGSVFEQGLWSINENFGYRIVTGYDITSETYIERPDLLLKAVKSILQFTGDDMQSKLQALRRSIPAEKRLLFDDLLHGAQEMGRLRNERGMYSDLWAVGILRHAYLKVGKRLFGRNLIHSPVLVLDASLEELVSLLEGVQAVSATQLQQRADYRRLFTVTDAPAVLGNPSTPFPAPYLLPPSLARTMAGLMTAFSLAVDHVRQADNRDALLGIPASRGAVEGVVRRLLSEDQIHEVRQGDILVVHQTTAAFDLIFPIIGGMIAEFGGVLSHPAILAREYGIPCVVGCSGAVEHLQTGMRVRLDGNTGVVRILPQPEPLSQRLEALRCEYSGPMQGRNRDRVFNHLETVSGRLKLLEAIRGDDRSIGILRSHFKGEISSLEAAACLVENLRQASMEISIEQLENFVRRHHLEFHPCDACNLHCHGCTYFQDTPSRPAALSFPIDRLARLCAVFQSKAITLVGGGEPALYRSGGHRLGDLVYSLGVGELGCAPAIGLISNGVLWPPGNPAWHQYVNWIRLSLDAATPVSYARGKGKNYFERIINHVFRLLTETEIPQVGVGFLYHPGNIAEAGPLIALLARRLREMCPDQLHRLNVQFRPWRMPTGRPSIQERILSQPDIERASGIFLSIVDEDPYIEQFTRQNTNIAVNLLCGGAREKVSPFSACFFGLAKTVVRADGSLYPCFRMAASQDTHFYCGNILEDSPLKIALRELHVFLASVQQICVPEHDKCLFCVFNNALEEGLVNNIQIPTALAGDYFF